MTATDTPKQTIFRKVKSREYTVIDNAVLNDKKLSFKAVGLLAFLLSKPDDWRFNYRHIATTHADGEAAVRAGMKELQKFGYLTRKRERQDDGTFAWVVTVHEEPEPCGGSPRMENPGVENDHLPSTDGASTEEQTLSLLSEPPSPSKSESLESEFEDWWSGVWDKDSKARAKQHYRRIRTKEGATRSEMFAGRDAYIRLLQAQETPKKFWKNPANWLSEGKWETDYGTKLEEAELERRIDAEQQFSGPAMRFG